MGTVYFGETYFGGTPVLEAPTPPPPPSGFTLITITGGPFRRPGGEPAQGRLIAKLTGRMRNGAQSVEPAPVYGILNGAGMLKDSTGESPLALEANDDPATSPASPTTSYALTLIIDGVLETFSAVVPHNAAGQTIDLSALVP